MDYTIEDFVDSYISGTTIDKVLVPICPSAGEYSYHFYDRNLKNIYFLLRRLYDKNLCSEQSIFEHFLKVNNYKTSEQINTLFFEEGINPIASFNLTTLEVSFYDYDSSKYNTFVEIPSILIDNLLTNIEDILILCDKKRKEYSYQSGMLDTKNGIMFLKGIYSDNKKKCKFFDFDEKKKWDKAIENLQYSSNKELIVQKEKENIDNRINDIDNYVKAIMQIHCSLMEAERYLSDYQNIICKHNVALTDLLVGTRGISYEQSCNCN